MPFEVLMPRLGWNMEKGTLVRWLKAEGEYVHAGEILFEVEADKATQEMEALESGVLHIPQGAPAPGSTVPVGTLLGYLLQEGESTSAARPALIDAAPQAAPTGPVSAAPAVLPGARVQSQPDKPAISPRARRVARELGVEWETLHGSGRTGRIVERDVRLAASSAATLVRPAAQARAAPLPEGPAPIYLTAEADATQFVRVCNTLEAGGRGTNAGCLDLLAVVVARALRDYPALNARREAGVAVLSDALHLRLITAGEEGRATGVLQNAERLTLAGVSRQTAALLAGGYPSDRGDATFNLIDLSRYDLRAFSPEIVPPACATLVLAGIATRNQGGGGTGETPHAMYLSLAVERGLVEEDAAAGFLNRVRRLVEQPVLLLL